MGKGDVSFSFMDRIREIEQNIEDKRWQSALALALTLPDICGGIAYPEMVRRYRDGRIMEDRKGNPARDTGRQYVLWFDTYGADFFRRPDGDGTPYLNGEKCWQLRCEYLHQNRGFDNDDGEDNIHFHLGVNCGSSICHLDREAEENGITNIRLDIRELCLRLCAAARAYHDGFRSEKDFSLYHTPVIDFIQWRQETEESGKKIMVLVEDMTFGQGICRALERPGRTCRLFTNVRDAGKWEEKKKTDLLVTEPGLLEKGTAAGRLSLRYPVLVLGDDSEDRADLTVHAAGADVSRPVAYIRRPFLLETLRSRAEQYL